LMRIVAVIGIGVCCDTKITVGMIYLDSAISLKRFDRIERSESGTVLGFNAVSFLRLFIGQVRNPITRRVDYRALNRARTKDMICALLSGFYFGDYEAVVLCHLLRSKAAIAMMMETMVATVCQLALLPSSWPSEVACLVSRSRT